MKIYTWNTECYYCRRPILGGRPTLLLSNDKPEIAGVSHSSCCFTLREYSHLQTCPPNYLSADRVSFWTHFSLLMKKLPSGFDPDRALLFCLVEIFFEMPDNLNDLIVYFRKFQVQSKKDVQDYRGDLECDFLKFLGQVQRGVKEHPVEVEVDFRRHKKGKQ